MMQADFFLRCVQVVVRTMTVAAAIIVTGCFDIDATQSAGIKIPVVTPVEPADQEDVTDQPLEQPIEEPIRPVDTPGALPIQVGDLNEDGRVDQYDLAEFGDGYLQYEDGDPFDARADLDGDGSVTLVDLRLLLDLIASGASSASDRPAFPR